MQLEAKIARIFAGDEQNVKETGDFALCLAKGFQQIISVYEASPS